MTERRDSLRELLGEHLDRAQAEGIAEQKADAMLAKPELRERIAELEKVPDGVTRPAQVASERTEHASAEVPASAPLPRTTARTVAIDERIDPRLLETEIVLPRRSRPNTPRSVALALACILAGGVAGWTARGGTPAPTSPSAGLAPAAPPASCPSCEACKEAVSVPCPAVQAPTATLAPAAPATALPRPSGAKPAPSTSSSSPRFVE